MKLKCKLTRILSVHANLRTDEILGSCEDKPQVGRRFFMTGPPLELEGGTRMVETTQVVEVTPGENPNVLDFKTVNSDYRWEFLGPGH